MKFREVLMLLRDAGWIQISQEGSHRKFKHPVRPGRVIVAGHPGDDVPQGTLRSILRQAGIGPQDRSNP